MAAAALMRLRLPLSKWLRHGVTGVEMAPSSRAAGSRHRPFIRWSWTARWHVLACERPDVSDESSARSLWAHGETCFSAQPSVLVRGCKRDWLDILDVEVERRCYA